MANLGNGGWVPKRRNIIEHLEDGRITPTEYLVHDIILLKADKATGIWRGSAKALYYILGDQHSEQWLREILQRLEIKGYIKRLRKHGKRGNYPVLVNKYVVTCGPRVGHMLNATLSTSLKELVYEDQGESEGGASSGTDRGNGGGSDTGDSGGSPPYSIPKNRNSKPETRKTSYISEPTDKTDEIELTETEPFGIDEEI